MGGSAKQAGQAASLGAKDGTRLTSQRALLAKRAAVVLLAILLAGCCTGRRGLASPLPTRIPSPLATCSDGGQNPLAAELERARQLQSRLGDEIAALAKSRDQLNESNTRLLNQLAREQEEVARLNAAVAIRAEASPPADAPPIRPIDADAPAAAAAPGPLAGILSHLVQPWAIAALTALGVSPPLAYAGWLLLRVIRRTRKARPQFDAAAGELQRLRKQVEELLSIKPPKQPASEVAPQAASTFHLEVEEHAPIERDDREGRELLRLRALEGHDPLQDAIAGCLIRPRLEAIADSQGDPQKAAWARELMHELDQEFNKVAPTKFTLKQQV